MVSLMDLRKLNETDIAAITRFIDRIRRTKRNYDQGQQALLDLANENLVEIVERYQSLHAPMTTDTMITKGFTDKKLKKAKDSLLAIVAKIGELKESAYTILAILGKLN